MWLLFGMCVLVLPLLGATASERNSSTDVDMGIDETRQDMQEMWPFCTLQV